MLEKLIEWSIKNKFLVIMLTIFAIGAGVWAIVTTPVDAIPDLSDVQVIVYTEYEGQSPRIVEDQVTYPLTTSLLSVPGARVVRGYSFFGYSLVYVIFKDGTDIYWARSRVLEYLNYAQKRLPAGVLPTLGPDATGVGWVYEYALTSPYTIAAGAALAPGLVPEIWIVKHRGRRRGGEHRRLCQAVPGDRGPVEAAGVRHSGRRHRDGDKERQQRRGRRGDRNGRNGVHDPRSRIYKIHRRHQKHPGQDRHAARRRRAHRRHRRCGHRARDAAGAGRS